VWGQRLNPGALGTTAIKVMMMCMCVFFVLHLPGLALFGKPGNLDKRGNSKMVRKKAKSLEKIV